MDESLASIVVLISGAGSNLRAIAQACEQQRWPARIAAVISNRGDAAGLQVAAELGLPAQLLEAPRGGDAAARQAYDRLLAQHIDAHAPAAVVLAGFMRVLGTEFVEHYRGRLINVHPSLLPAFPGLHTHRRALEAGVKWHGATVHLVTPELDSGPIVEQAVVPVLDDDTEASLRARVQEQEHRVYPTAVRALVEGRLRVQGQRVRVLAATESLR